jgi:hypothetical protein
MLADFFGWIDAPNSDLTLLVGSGKEPGDRFLDIGDANRLFEVGVTAGLKGVLVIGFVAVGRVIENRDCRIKGTQFLAKFHAGTIWQADIEDIEVKIDFLREFQTFSHAAGGENSVAAILQKSGHHEAGVLMIIHVKDASLGPFHIRFLPGP